MTPLGPALAVLALATAAPPDARQAHQAPRWRTIGQVAGVGAAPARSGLLRPPAGFGGPKVSWGKPLLLHTTTYGLDVASSLKALQQPGAVESGSLGPGFWGLSMAGDLGLQRFGAPRWLLWGWRIVVTGLRLGATWSNFNFHGPPTTGGREGNHQK